MRSSSTHRIGIGYSDCGEHSLSSSSRNIEETTPNRKKCYCSSDIDRLAGQLADLERRGLGHTPEANAIRQQLRDRLRELADFMRRVLTDRVVEDFADISTPLKQFVDAAKADPSQPNRERNLDDKSHNLRAHTGKCTSTARFVASCGPSKNKKTVEAILDTADKVRVRPSSFNSSRQ